MIAADETFEGTFPFAPHFSTAPGFRMHYVDEGKGKPVLLLHGEPTWGYIYRNFIPALAKTNRVIVPDHMGFGKSETPQDRAYILKTHVENLIALVEDLDLEDITVVGQDWGGPFTGCLGALRPERVARIVLLSTVTAQSGIPAPYVSRWFQWIGKHHDAGTLDEVLGNLGSNILSVMKIVGFENTGAVDDTWIRAYSAPFPDKASCIGAMEFPLDVYLGRAFPYLAECAAAGAAALRSKPALLVSAHKDFAIPREWAVADFKAQWPLGPIVELPNAGHYCQEDAPETIVALIQLFMQTS